MTWTVDTLLDIGVILALLAAIGFMLLFMQRQRLLRDLQALSQDMLLAENVARIGYWSRDFFTHRVTWSAGMYDLFEQDTGSFKPTIENVAPLFLAEDLPAVRALTNPDIRNRNGGEAEARIRCPSGSIKDVLVVTRFQLGKGDKITRVFGIVADITARKMAERATAEREEQLQSAISAMGAGIWDWDIGSDRLFAGARFAEILGLDPLTFAPTMTMHHQLCHPDDLPRVQEAFRNSVKTGEPYAIEYRMRHRESHYVWVSSRGRVVSYDGPRPVRAIGTVIDVTERQRVEEQLRRGRESLDFAMEASQAGYFDILLARNEVFWSPRALQILGLDQSGPHPTPDGLLQVIHPEDLPEFLAEREEFRLRKTEPLDTQVRVSHDDGSHRWIHLRAVHLFDPAGEPYRIIGILRDVSAGVQAQQALADSERKFRNLIEGSLQGVLILHKRKPLFCNVAFARIFGYERVDEVLALDNLGDHLPADRQDEVKGDWDRALRRELEGTVRRNRIYDRAGRLRWIEVVERLIHWEGQPARQLAVLDVTEQEAFQARLRASEERFRLLADNVSDIITLYDQDQVLRYVSPSIERIAGYKPEDVIGRDMYCMTVPEEMPPADRRAELAKSPFVGTYVWRLLRKDKAVIWVESTSSLVPAAPGQKGYAVVSAIRDVTERVTREHELSAARDRLKDQADELTVLAQNLEMERERAEQANAAKSQFLAMMSHELRTPMTGVMGMADLLLMSNLTPEQDDLTKLLKRSARVLLDLLNDILDFSKIEAGQLEIEAIPFSLTEVLADVVNLFAPIASEKGITLDSNMPPAFWNAVTGDPKRLRQVLSNLVGNAIKFTERGRITIGFTQTPHSGDALMLQFRVTDTGIGISQEDAHRLFRPFVQADVSTSRKYGGTGLGLAISKRLVEGMGGQIGVNSEPGHGSTFAFSVRVVPDRTVPQIDAQAIWRRSGADVKAGPVVGTPRMILIAEDNETSRYLIMTMLARIGHSVDAVANGAEAVAAVHEKAYDIILMDMQMPVMDGPEATREIRKLKSGRAHIPIIALTADIIASHRSAYLNAGVNAIVGKPVNWAELSEEIERQLAPATVPEKATAKKADAAPGGPTAFDDQAINDLADVLGEDVLAPMLETFSANMAQYREDLAAAVGAGDLKQAKRTAHALKGLCAQFGAVRASELAKAIEMEADTFAAVTPVLPLLIAALAAAEEGLAARRARMAKLTAQKAG